MKNINKILLSILFILPLCFISCTDEDNMELNKGSEELILAATESEVVLDVAAPETNAVTFSWGAGSNQGTNAAITYSFQLAIKGTDFQNPISQEFEKGDRSAPYTMEGLNEILLTSFGIEPDNEVEIEARVVATIHSDKVEPLVSNIVSIKLTTYKPVAKNLYIIGPAANGWSADKGIAMNKLTGVAGGFTWTGQLKSGLFKFITTPGNFIPAYSKGADDAHLHFRESSDDPSDDNFEIEVGGTYRITLNIITLAINVEKLVGPDYSDLWFVGDATDWKFRSMTIDALDPFVFHYNAELTTGDFKIATIDSFDDNTPYIRPKVANQGPGTDLDYVVSSKNDNSSDDKWKITTPGAYKISLDQKTKKISIVPFTPYSMIYLVGDATPGSWTLANATPMTVVDDYKFEWTGTLKVGEMKFSCEKPTDWDGAWFLATAQGQTPSGTEVQMLFSYPGSDPDNKWRIETEGQYTIELDQLKQTVKITKN